MRAPLPVAATVKVAVCVVYSDAEAGWLTITGPGATSITVSAASLLTVDPPAFDTTTEYRAPLSANATIGVV